MGEFADGDVVHMQRVPRVGTELRFRWSSEASVAAAGVCTSVLRMQALCHKREITIAG